MFRCIKCDLQAFEEGLFISLSSLNCIVLYALNIQRFDHKTCGYMVNYCPLEWEWDGGTIKLHVIIFISPGLFYKKLAQIVFLMQHGVRSLHENGVGGHREPFRQECCIQLMLFNVKLRRQEII